MEDFLRAYAMRGFWGGGSGGGLRDIIENGIPANLYDAEAESVAETAFWGLYNLKSVDLPMAKTVGERAFAGCESLNSINLPMVEDIWDYSFQSCTTLKSVNLPVVKTIGSLAFEGNKALESINLPEAETLGMYAFEGCENLDTIIFGRANVSLDYGCLWDCPITAFIIRDTENLFDLQTNAQALSENSPVLSGEGFIYIPASMWDAYAAVYGDYIALFRKIEDYPEICG